MRQLYATATSAAGSSASSCFAFGYGPTSSRLTNNVVVPIAYGRPGSPQKINAFISGATCTRVACLGVGSAGQYPSPQGAVLSFSG